MPFKHIDIQVRQTIASLLEEGKTITEIAQAVGLHRSSISREISRNSVGDRYVAEEAEELARRRHASKPKRTKWTPELREKVVGLLLEGLSPKKISERLREEGGSTLHTETIYRFIYKDREEGGDLYTYLPIVSKR